MNDIDLSSESDWTGLTLSGGVFDGNGHVIKNLKSTQGGLFSSITNAEIKNVGLNNVNINVTATNSICIGSLADIASGSTISNCFVKGNITQSSTDCPTLTSSSTDGYNVTVGGLIGSVATVTVENCFFSGNVVNKIKNASQTITSGSGLGGAVTMPKIYVQNGSTGGLIGYDPSTSGSTIKNCYTTGSVSGNMNTGGLIGIKGNVLTNLSSGAQAGFTNGSEISNCYTECDVKAQDTSNASGGTIGIVCGLIQEGIGIAGMETPLALTATDVFANTSASTIKTNPDNCEGISLLSGSQFNSTSTWKNYDGNVWEKNSSVPKLKNMAALTYNFSGSNEFRLQVGSGSDSATNAMFVDTGIALGELEIDLSTTDNCLDAVNCIQQALNAVAQKTSDIGVAQSRLEIISAANTTKIENLSAAYTAVAGADTAEETLNYTKAQIMASTATSLITQTQYFQANLLLKLISSIG